MSNIDWSKAPEGFPIWIEGLNGMFGTGWHRDDGDRWLDQQGSYWPKGADERGNCRIHLAPWSGEGLPPVGTVCEVHARSGDPYWERHIGKQVKIVAHSLTTSGDPVAVYETKDSDGFNEYHGLVEGNFRRIKTPEQIAAELRTATIKRAAELCPFPRADSTLVVLEALYDNGILKGDAK